MSIRIEPIGTIHRPLLKEFRNQHPSLVEYLRRFALRHSQKDHLSRTYLALDQIGFTQRIAGYFSLSTAGVERSSVAPIASLDSLPRFPIPAVLLARLAVDEGAQGQGLGTYLFDEALGLTLQLARTVAFRLFVTDAIDSEAARFYLRFGLVQLSRNYPARMVLDLAPLIRE